MDTMNSTRIWLVSILAENEIAARIECAGFQLLLECEGGAILPCGIIHRDSQWLTVLPVCSAEISQLNCIVEPPQGYAEIQNCGIILAVDGDSKRDKSNLQVRVKGKLDSLSHPTTWRNGGRENIRRIDACRDSGDKRINFQVALPFLITLDYVLHEEGDGNGVDKEKRDEKREKIIDWLFWGSDWFSSGLQPSYRGGSFFSI